MRLAAESSVRASVDRHWMQRAIELAHRAERENEVPIGALVVKQGKCIGEGWNRPIASHDPSAHAEIVALRAAGQAVGNYRLVETTLYVTLEPCVMCFGAIIHARVQRLVFGAADPKLGAVSSAMALTTSDAMNHRVEWVGGILAPQCRAVLKTFFEHRR